MEKFSEEMKSYIVNNYYNKTAKELASELGVSYQYIKKVWTSNNLKGKENIGKTNDLLNQKFGYLTVIGKSDKRSANGSIYWICKCDCGRKDCQKVKEILGPTLKNGRAISCGAIGKEKLNKGRGLNFKDLTGKSFGALTVIKRKEDADLKGRKAVQWECKCKCGRTTVVLASNLKTGNTQSCGLCSNNSHGNNKIDFLLSSNNILFEREKRFATCKGKTCLPFDFYVDNKYLIEYDGKQHYYTNTNNWFSKEELKKIQEHDLIKSKWCKENNIPLIRIPYTHYESLTIEDLLLETSQFLEK